MKKLIGIIALVALSVLLLTACGEKNEAPVEDLPMGFSCEGELPDGKLWNITVDGATLTVTLPANHTTGYQWKVYQAAEDVNIFKLTNEEYITDSNEKGMVGVGGTSVFTFECTEEGYGELFFAYQQDWDGGEIAYEYILTCTTEQHTDFVQICNDLVFEEFELSFDTDTLYGLQ